MEEDFKESEGIKDYNGEIGYVPRNAEEKLSAKDYKEIKRGIEFDEIKPGSMYSE